MSKLIDKRFDFRQIDVNFKHNLPTGHLTYTTILPPPNLTGALHIGHALVFSVQDAILRYQAGLGHNTKWFAGTDHSGISGQLMFTKHLEQHNILPKSQAERDKLMSEWVCEKQDTIRSQADRMQLCMDWSDARFTLSDSFSNWVTQIFVKLFSAGYITRGTRLVYWDPKFQTALSDLEVDMIETQGTMHYIHYLGVDCEGITVATTRPETLFGDVAVAVHPDDTRYAHLIGRHVLVPIVGREVPIVGDTRCKQDKGTGAVKITPAHDFLDYAIGKDHNLESIQVIDKNCQMINCALEGQDRFVARSNTVNILRELGQLVREESITHTTPHGNRGGALLEVLPTAQWFCEMRELADCALQQLDQITIHPESQRKVLVSWLEHIEPWCISRQLWWGHRIPVWYDAHNRPFAAANKADAMQLARAHYGNDATIELTQDPDVLDTWFSSALWSFAIGEYHNQPIVHDILTTGRDILNGWVARMIMLSIFHNGEVPFKTVLLTGLVRDGKGQKMSKTLGNVIDPADMIEKHGADATRLWLLSEVLPEKANICVSESTIELQSHLLTKLWNCVRYCLSKSLTTTTNLRVQHPWNQYWIHRVQQIKQSVARDWAEYRIASLYQTIYHGLWDEFANCYLEGAKAIWNAETSYVASGLLREFLTMLHPLAPGITTELLQHVPCNTLPDVAYSGNVQDWIATAEIIRSFATLTKIQDFVVQGSQEVSIEVLCAITNCKLVAYSDTEGLVRLIDTPVGSIYINQSAVNQASAGILAKLDRITESISRNQKTQESFNAGTPQHVVAKKTGELQSLLQQQNQLKEYLDLLK